MLTAVSIRADAAVKTKWFYEVRAMAWLLWDRGGSGNPVGIEEDFWEAEIAGGAP